MLLIVVLFLVCFCILFIELLMLLRFIYFCFIEVIGSKYANYAKRPDINPFSSTRLTLRQVNKVKVKGLGRNISLSLQHKN